MQQSSNEAMKHELYEEPLLMVPLLLFSHKENEYELHSMFSSEQKKRIYNSIEIEIDLRPESSRRVVRRTRNSFLMDKQFKNH